MTPDDARRLLGRGVSLAGVFDGGPGQAPALTSPLRYVDLVHAREPVARAGVDGANGGPLRRPAGPALPRAAQRTA